MFWVTSMFCGRVCVIAKWNGKKYFHNSSHMSTNYISRKVYFIEKFKENDKILNDEVLNTNKNNYLLKKFP